MSGPVDIAPSYRMELMQRKPKRRVVRAGPKIDARRVWRVACAFRDAMGWCGYMQLVPALAASVTLDICLHPVVDGNWQEMSGALEYLVAKYFFMPANAKGEGAR